MTHYELMFIVRPDIENEEAVDQQIERYGRLVVDNGGEVTGVDKWGRRRFAFEVKGFTEGYYVVIQFKAESATVDELDRILRISDEIVRHIVVRLDEDESKSAAVEEDEPAQAQAEAQAEAQEEAPSEDAPASDPAIETDEAQTAAT